MKVIIAEKPDQAKKLAEPFAHKKRTGYIEIMPNEFFPQGACVTWAIGHICELLPPEGYNPSWKRWSLQTLPILPERFRYRVMAGKRKQFQAIKGLLTRKDVKEIILAGDAGREGELIVRTVVEQAGVTKPMKRLWISSLTPKAVRAGFAQLLDERETRSLYHEAFSRACADWLIGMNASRIYTLLFKQKGIADVFSVGRVQTPTLALIVKREKEIAQFQSRPFWEVVARFQVNGKEYMGTWQKEGETRLQDQALAEKISQFCQNKPAAIHKVEPEWKEYLPPMLFNLSSLQATANKLFKWSPKKTLDVAQQLYLKGVISYPRSDSSFVTAGEAESFPEIMTKLAKQAEYQPFFPAPVPSIRSNRRYVNAKKVTDHYAIIPTEQVPQLSRLAPDERKLYDLIARRLIAAHHNPAIMLYTTVTTLVDERATFVSKGKHVLQEGWRRVLYGAEAQEGEDEPMLPELAEGEQGRVAAVRVKEGKTQPPKRYTEGELITLMKTAGKHLQDEELEKVLMKTEGLGTEATRAGIITLLKQRQYIDVRKNQVFATPKGMLLIEAIEAIGNKILASPEMTAKWEQRLEQIGQGEASAEDFMEQARRLTVKLIEDAKAQAAQWVPPAELETAAAAALPQRKRGKTASAKGGGVSAKARGTSATTAAEEIGPCRKCGGQIVDRGGFYGCAHFAKHNCTFTLPKTIAGKRLTLTNVKKLLATGKSNLIKGLKRPDGLVDGYLIWEADGLVIQPK